MLVPRWRLTATLLRLHRQPCRQIRRGFASESTSTQPSAHPMVKLLNLSLSRHPLSSFFAYFVINMSSFGVLFAGYSLSGFNYPALATGFAISAAAKRFRLPIDLAATSVLARLAPSLTTIKVGALVTAPLATGAPQPALLGKVEAMVTKYGAAFIVERAGMGLASCAAFTYIIQAGIDPATLPSFLHNFLSSETVCGLSAASSSMAGAVVTNTCLLPFRVAAVPVIAPYLAPFADRIQKEMDEKNRHQNKP